MSTYADLQRKVSRMDEQSDRRKHTFKVAQKEGCNNCKNGRHWLCTRRKFLGTSKETNEPIWDCCCGGEPSVVKFSTPKKFESDNRDRVVERIRTAKEKRPIDDLTAAFDNYVNQHLREDTRITGEPVPTLEDLMDKYRRKPQTKEDQAQ